MEDVTAGPGLRQLHVCNLYSPLTCFPEGSPGEQRAGRTPGTASFPPTRFFWKSLWSRCHLGDCPFFVRGLAYPTYNWRHKTEISHYESQTNAHKLALTTKKKGVRRATPQRLKAVTLALPLPAASHQHSGFWDVLRGRILCRAGQW